MVGTSTISTSLKRSQDTKTVWLRFLPNSDLNTTTTAAMQMMAPMRNGK